MNVRLPSPSEADSIATANIQAGMAVLLPIINRESDPFAWWRAAVEGRNPPIHSDPECGYFKVRDRRGLNKNLAPIKRPWIACAIWPGEDGRLQAELAGAVTAVDSLWPYCAKYPIPYEIYSYWHQHERWPEPETAS